MKDSYNNGQQAVASNLIEMLYARNKVVKLTGFIYDEIQSMINTLSVI